MFRMNPIRAAPAAIVRRATGGAGAGAVASGILRRSAQQQAFYCAVAAASGTGVSGAAPQQWVVRRCMSTAEKEAAAKALAEAEAESSDLVKEELARLRAEIKKAAEEAAENKKTAQYSAAEANNARRIAAEDVAKAKQFGITSFAKDMLEVNDTLERAIEAFGKLNPEEVKFLTEHKLFSQLVTGVKLSHSQMLHNLGRHGVEHIAAEAGEDFDTSKHDAVFNAPENELAKEGQLAVIVKKGYMLKSRVLRAVQVGVAQKQG